MIRCFEPSPTLWFRNRFRDLNDVAYFAACSIAPRSYDVELSQKVMLDDLSSGNFFEYFEAICREVRGQIATLIGANEDQIALLPNTSVAAYQAISQLPFEQRKTIIASTTDFPAMPQVLSGQRSRGAELHFAETPRINFGPTEFIKRIDDRCQLVSIELVNYRDGSRAPAKLLIEAARKAGAKTLVDAYQALGVEPVDVNQLDCDFLVGGLMKYLLGLPGLAFLYSREPSDDSSQPLTGWLGRSAPFDTNLRNHCLPKSARRFEIGTLSAPSIYAAQAALNLVGQLDVVDIRDHVTALAEVAVARLCSDGETIVGPMNPTFRGAHVAVLEREPRKLAEWLRKRKIFTSPRGDVLRLAIHRYVTREDVEAACSAIWEYRKWNRGVS